MAVTIARGLEEHLRGTIVLLIRSDDPPSLVAAGVRAAVGDIAATGSILATGEDVIAGEVIGRDGKRWRPTDREWEGDERLAGAELPAYVADPVTIPGGQLLMIDYSSTPPRLCGQTPGILLRHLETARVQNALIGLAPELSDRRYRVLESLTPVAWAGLRTSVAPYPRGGLAAVPDARRLIDIATGWLRGQSRAGMELLALVINTEVPLTWDAVAPVVTDVLASGGYMALVASDFRVRAAVAVLGDLALTGVSLRAASAPPAVERVAAAMRGQRDVIRAVAAGVGWAGVTSHRNPSPAFPPYRARPDHPRRVRRGPDVVPGALARTAGAAARAAAGRGRAGGRPVRADDRGAGAVGARPSGPRRSPCPCPAHPPHLTPRPVPAPRHIPHLAPWPVLVPGTSPIWRRGHLRLPSKASNLWIICVGPLRVPGLSQGGGILMALIEYVF